MLTERAKGAARRLVAALWVAVALAGALAIPAGAEATTPMGNFIQDNYVDTLGLIPALALLALLSFTVRIDSYIRPNLKRTMGIGIAAVVSLVLQNYLEYRVVTRDFSWLARTLLAIYGYAVRPAILVLFMKVIAPQKRFGWAWALVGLNAAVNATALFSPICFQINRDNTFTRGPLGNSCLIVSAILLAYWFILTIRVLEPQKHKETWVPVLGVALIVGALVMDYSVVSVGQPISYLTMAVVIDSVMYYIWLHLQFVREHEQALLAEQRIQIMMTQIQPHFLFNTIATIRALCRRDAEKAGDVAEKFGDYLRQNLDSLGIVGGIPFRRELEHTKIYAEIEMVRFENIRVEYDIRDEDFMLPPLTLQPLVENAIRHGVRIREAGVVWVATRRVEGGHEITVRDNGTGFDVAEIDAADSSHIGIRNVRERIEGLCGGSLAVDSRIGAGTTVTITIPDREGGVSA